MAANNNSVNFKVFLRDDSSTEARRFVVDDASVVTSFLFMREKLQIIFPKLQGTIFRITWKDSDGDEITVDSDEDLLTAFTEMNGGTVKILYVTILERKSAQQDTDAGQFHGFRGRVVCDVCENPITGYRYKCMQCPDYDLCSTCEFDGHHAEHMMLRTSRSNEFPFGKCTRKVMEHINKSIRKGNHMAYKEACRSSKYKGKYDRMWGDNRRNQSDQEQPQTSQQQQQNEAPESSTRQEQRPSGCPMQDINLENITPLIYPFLDALNNPEADNTGGNNQGAPHFMNLIRNAINGFFDGAAHSQQQNQQSAPESSDVPTTAAAAAATSSETTPPNQKTPVRNIPMDIEKEMDAASKAPQSESVPRREPGWTIIGNQSFEAASKPTAPSDRENSKIADGLKQLLDMGFSDELNLVALLRRFDGNVGEVVKYLFEHNI